MSFVDIFKQSFLEGYQSVDIKTILVSLAISCVFACYIFFVYRGVTRKTFYSRTFNICLAGVTIITSAIILTIQASIVVSLGMVGALSIVRFRTAIKDPMDLMFLFWAIGTGIICGAGIAEIAVILAIILTVGILLLSRIPLTQEPQLLVVNASDLDIEKKVIELAEQYAKHPVVKSRNMTDQSLDLILELRTDRGQELVREIMRAEGVRSVSLMTQDGETNF